MSSHQWRMLRHYLSNSSLGAELDKLLQKVKLSSPEQWDNLVKKLETAVWSRVYTQTQPQIEGQRVEENKQTESVTPSVTTSTTNTVGATATATPTPTLDDIEKVPTQLSDLSFEKLWQGLRLKKDLTLGLVSRPSWKTNKDLVTKTSVQSRTTHLVRALDEARSAASAAARCDELARHLLAFPASRDLAARAGAVPALLRLRREHRRDAAAVGAARAALALAGWAAPPRAPGPRVLALDGGGVRGLVAIEILRALEAATGRRVRDLFDLIVGVSTGAIIAAAIAGDAGTLDEAAALYRSLARETFGDTSVIGGASRLVWTRAYYDTARWERVLRERLGDAALADIARGAGPHLALVSARAAGGGRLTPFVFRTYGGAARRAAALAGGGAAPVWLAVRASAAAPTYFEELELEGARHSDGGLLCNNPAGVALLETRLLYGSLRGAVLVSVGTGRAPGGGGAAAGWRERFEAVLESATDTERVHQLLAELLPPASYFRLNPALTASCALDETREERLAALAADARHYVRRNAAKLRAAAAALARPRPPLQRLSDQIREHAVRLGVVDP